MPDYEQNAIAASDSEISSSQELIQIYSKLTPEQVAEEIFREPPPVIAKNPQTGEAVELKPKIEITPVDPKHASLAEEFVPIPETITNGGRDRVSRSLGKVKQFLKAPSINDGFRHHRDRRLWEKGVGIILSSLDQQSGKDPKNEDSYTKTFQDKWGNNKLALANFNSPNQLANFIDLLSDPKNDQELIRSVESASKTFTETYNSLTPTEQAKSQPTNPETVEAAVECARQIFTALQQSQPAESA